MCKQTDSRKCIQSNGVLTSPAVTALESGAVSPSGEVQGKKGGGKLAASWASREWKKWRKEMGKSWRDARGVNVGIHEAPEERNVRAARERYAEAVKEGGRISRKAVSSGFEDERSRTFGEYGEFLASIGCEDIEAAEGVDVVAFVQGWWLPGHQKNFRTKVAGRSEKVASASAVKGVIGHIAKNYSMLGVKDEANPAKSEAAEVIEKDIEWVCGK
ncbi:hypothetical protein KFL_014330030 [Klebsormidium nitens]|uniref:Uncharacterized protein n=1 Tax=Klebsormidium nitens TaxID=105231 RepID=A0A1Y1IV97_KLENI|nr:hypothetical protein KFL_014330030 [Klebsormidium nitens]|eukprot:GAQ93311.1 hypothetical protein KFL_014330030 [Klebsormidium nitens]